MVEQTAKNPGKVPTEFDVNLTSSSLDDELTAYGVERDPDASKSKGDVIEGPS